MERKKINFKKARDFGDLLSDTFLFLKLEFKPLIKALLTYVGPFILITGFLSAWYQTSMYENMFDFSGRDPLAVYRSMFSFQYFLVLMAGLISNTLMVCAVYSYIKLYITKGPDGFMSEEVWRMMGQRFLSVLGALIVISIIVALGFVLCIVPGVYLFVIFSLVLPVIVIEETGLGQAMERSMALIKEHFWFTLGIGVVIMLITGVASYIFLLPQVIISFAYGFTSISGGESSSTFSVLLTIFTVIGTFGSAILYSIPFTTFGLHYYSQLEKKESPNLINKINQINEPEDDNNNSSLGF